MRLGDVVEWRGVNHMITGEVKRIGNGQYLVVATRYGNFPLRIVSQATSFRVLYNVNDK